MNIHPKKLQAVEIGRVSDTLLNVFGERLTHQKEMLLKKLIVTHRMGDKDKLESQLAAYCALEDFESELRKEVMAGRNAAKEIAVNGTQ